MSEQTPNLSTKPPLQDGVEPSMEDILASIRKIISDDEPVALESPEDIASFETSSKMVPEMENATAETILEDAVSEVTIADNAPTLDAPPKATSLSAKALPAAEPVTAHDSMLSNVSSEVNRVGGPSSEVDMASLIQSVALDEQDVATEIEAAEVLELDETDLLLADVMEMPAVEPNAVIASIESVRDGTPELEGRVAQLEVQGRDEILESVIHRSVEDTNSAENVDEVAPLADSADDATSELDTLLDEMATGNVLDELEVDLADIQSEDIQSEDIQSEDEAAPIEVVSAVLVETSQDPDPDPDPDLALVKSLMADLADKPVVDEDVDAFTAEVSAMENAPQEQVDILDEILDASIDNQAVASPVETNFVEVSPIDVNLDEVSPGAMNEATETVEPDLDSILADEQANLEENGLAAGDVVELSELSELSAQLDEMSLEFGASITDDVPQTDSFDVSLAELSATHTAIDPALTAENMSSLSDIGAESSETLAPSGAGPNDTAPSSLADIVAATSEDAEGLAADIITDEITTDEITTDPMPIQNAPDVSFDADSGTLNSNISPTDPQEEASMPVTAISDQAILKDATESASAFASLNKVVEDKAILKERGPRIGDLVQEALRPMLKEWLDENLKDIVERAVNKEVKRISKGN